MEIDVGEPFCSTFTIKNRVAVSIYGKKDVMGTNTETGR